MNYYLLKINVRCVYWCDRYQHLSDYGTIYFSESHRVIVFGSVVVVCVIPCKHDKF